MSCLYLRPPVTASAVPIEQERGDHGEDHAEEVQLEDAAGADQGREQAADDRTDQAEPERGEDAEVLSARLEQACDRLR